MTAPAVSLILCTVRESNAYAQHPEWDVLGRVITDLEAQVDAPPFELVIVDGLYEKRPFYDSTSKLVRADPGMQRISVRHVPPRAGSPWVRMKKVAISAYRNTGIAASRGELIINLDDCCCLPPDFVSTFWRSWHERGVAAAMCWPQRGDLRTPGMVTRPGSVYGFGSYPRELALELNGYDEAYDGGQGLEDMDWSTRLHLSGLQQALVDIPGFDIADQTGHSPRAIDVARPVVKCCNAAWQLERVRRRVMIANQPALWSRAALEALVGPCPHLHGEMCGHHGDRQRCAYLGVGFATALDPEAAVVFDEPPVLDLRALSEEYTR